MKVKVKRELFCEMAGRFGFQVHYTRQFHLPDFIELEAEPVEKKCDHWDCEVRCWQQNPNESKLPELAHYVGEPDPTKASVQDMGIYEANQRIDAIIRYLR